MISKSFFFIILSGAGCLVFPVFLVVYCFPSRAHKIAVRLAWCPDYFPKVTTFRHLLTAHILSQRGKSPAKTAVRQGQVVRLLAAAASHDPGMIWVFISHEVTMWSSVNLRYPECGDQRCCSSHRYSSTMTRDNTRWSTSSSSSSTFFNFSSFSTFSSWIDNRPWSWSLQSLENISQ